MATLEALAAQLQALQLRRTAAATQPDASGRSRERSAPSQWPGSTATAHPGTPDTDPTPPSIPGPYERYREASHLRRQRRRVERVQREVR
eukprot:5192824-Amphidinium_carterae.1